MNDEAFEVLTNALKRQNNIKDEKREKNVALFLIVNAYAVLGGKANNEVAILNSIKQIDKITGKRERDNIFQSVATSYTNIAQQKKSPSLFSKAIIFINKINNSSYKVKALSDFALSLNEAGIASDEKDMAFCRSYLKKEIPQSKFWK